MKKLFLFAFILALLAGCQSPELETINDDVTLKGGEKVTLCKENGSGEYTLIDVNAKALETHLANGAKLPYSIAGEYYIVRDKDNGPGNANWNIILHDDGGGLFSGTGTGIDANGVEVYVEISGTVNEDNSFDMVMDQYFVSNDEYQGTHNIEGYVGECGGISDIPNDGVFDGDEDYFLMSVEDNKKVTICHLDEYGNYFTIEISKNALEDHMAHGDKYTYSPEGDYNIIRDYKNSEYAKWTITIDSFEGNMFSGTGSGVDANSVEVGLNITGEVFDDHTFSMEMAQYWMSEPTNIVGTHYLSGMVDECGGIVTINHNPDNDIFGDLDKDYWFQEDVEF